MSNLADEREKPAEILTIRERPVGFVPGRWGGAFVAVERGYFPVSSTGYRSCTGWMGRTDIPAEEKREFLKRLAEDQDRDRAALLKDLRMADRLVGDPISNYIQASMAYERAIEHGLFATDRQRAALWTGAHRLLCLVTENKAFQPAEDGVHVAWNAEQCAKSLAYARELRRLLGQWAAGDMREAPPVRMIGAHGYFELPEKPGGEPRIELGGYTAEFGLSVATHVMGAPVVRREPVELPKARSADEIQLGLFEGGSSLRVNPSRRAGPSSPM